MAPSPVTSIILDQIPFKVLSIILLFIPIAPYMVEIHYLDVRQHTPSRMCSPRYTGYSRVLDMPVTLPDGGVQAGGWEYPPGAVWWGSGVAHGCPCSVGPCIRPCCPDGFYKRNVTLDFTELYDYICSDLIDEESVKSKPLSVLSLTDKRLVTISRKHFPTLQATCGGGLDVDERAMLTTDGQVVLPWGMIEPSKYPICFNIREDHLMMKMVFVCSRNFTRDENDHLRSIRVSVLFTVVLGTVTALLVVTLVTYLLVPHLRPAHCGGSFTSYVFALLVFKVIQLFNAWSDLYFPNIKHLDAVVDSWSNAVVMWQGLIVYQMWTTFNPHKLTIPNRGEVSARFIWYSVTIWGTVVLVFLWVLFIPGIKIYVYLQLVVLLTTLCLNVAALLRIRACLLCASKFGQRRDSQRHNAKDCRWSSLFLKFSMVTSLEFTLIILFSNLNALFNGMDVRSNSPTRYLFGLQSYFISLLGAEIFFMNVWNKRTWTVLGARLLSKSTSKSRNT